MKNYFKYIAILALPLGVISCEPELSNPIDEQGHYSNGEADFSNYVALGNSLTAGYADGALYLTGQENSYPNILAGQFAKVQETETFDQPLVNDNAGGLLLGGQKIADTRYVLSVDAQGNPSPKRYRGAEPTTEVSNTLSGSFNNMGVPGAKSYHLVAPHYGDIAGLASAVPTANPYFVRFASSAETTVLADAMAQDPTFFSLWIGNNDVLGYATSGGTGVDQTNNTNPATYGPNDISDPNAFYAVYKGIVDGLTSNGAGGVLLNIPDVTSVPFFTTVPNNALVLNAEQAAQLTGYFQAVYAIFTQVLMQKGLPAEQAQAVASQYAINFSEGPNRFLIQVEKSQTNPLGFRQMTEEEMLLLTIDQSALAQGYGSVMLTPDVMQVLGILQQGGQPTAEQAELVLDAVSGIKDEDALDSEELAHIEAATTAFNEAIAAVAQDKGLALVDANAMLTQLANGGISYDGGTLTAAFATGGAFSLDGIHLTPRGYAVVANKIIEAVNATYKSEVPKVNLGDYATITVNNEVN